MLTLTGTGFVFLLVLTGATLPFLASSSSHAPLTRLALALASALIGLYLAALATYHAQLPWAVVVLFPLMGALFAWRRRTSVAAFFNEPLVRTALGGWSMLAVYSVLMHSLVVSYSGGGWAGDWYEHYERTRFFLQRWPANHLFLETYSLPARPPMANLVTAGFLALSGTTFASYQVVTTLLSSLIFFPLSLIAGKAAAGLRWLVVLLMLNPLFVHNVAYPWTKLVAGFFIVLSVMLIWQARHEPRAIRWVPVMFAAGIVSHYSTVPWLLAFGGTGWWLLNSKLREVGSGYGREALIGSGIALALALTWFGWAASSYGIGYSIHATSTVSHAPITSAWGHVMIAVANVRHTILPDLDSPILGALMQQPHVTSRLRDFAFCLYQQNLLVALGLSNVLLIGWLLARQRGNYGRQELHWLVSVVLIVAVGATVHTWPVDLGLTHICLQALVLMGVAWLATKASTFGFGAKAFWGAGLAVDWFCGIFLHFGIMSLLLPRWLAPGNTDSTLIWHFSGAVITNFNAKRRLAEPFLADNLPSASIVACAAGVLLVSAIAISLRRPGIRDQQAATDRHMTA